MDRDPSQEGSLNRGSFQTPGSLNRGSFQTPGNPSTGGSGGSFQISEGSLTERINKTHRLRA